MDLSWIDHLVVAAPDVDVAVRSLEEQFGVPFQAGGQHPAWGTCNSILPLGPSVYLEVIGPDPTASHSKPPTLFGLDRLSATSLVSWAVKAPDLRLVLAQAQGRGLPVGEAVPGQRIRPDGSELRWILSDPVAVDPDSLVPFFIEWSGAHPANGWGGAVELISLEAQHPRPEEFRRNLGALGIELPIAEGMVASLIATLRTPNGDIQLQR